MGYTDTVQLMSHLNRHFRYFAEVEPRIAEALLVPFHVAGEAVGAIWVVSYEDLQRFAYAAAHDLRAPLNSSIGMLELLDRRTEARLEEGDHHLLTLARANLQRLQVLMNDLLVYSQLGDALQTALANLQEDIEGTGAQIERRSLACTKRDSFPADARVSESDRQCAQIPR